MSNREPKWSTWDLLPKVELWEAVALSFDIDPDKIKRPRHESLAVSQPMFDEGKDFDDRLRIIKANIGNHELLKGRQDCTLRSINLVIFAKWATTIGWEIPPKLESIGHKYVDDVSHVENNPQIINDNEDVAGKSLSVRERETMVKIIHALAKNGYKYPQPGTLTDIINDFDFNNNGVCENTLRKYLKEFDSL
ncbi:MAG: hypothetical protein WCH01_22660 [Methylococcaceae bacterium]